MEIEKYNLYDGEINLEFDPKNHIYRIGDRIVYGVTSIVNVIGKPALIYWAVNQCIDNLKSIWEAGKSYDEIEILNILTTAKNIHTEKKNQSATIGDLAHKWIEDYIKAKIEKYHRILYLSHLRTLLYDYLIEGTNTPTIPVNKQLENSINAFLKWEKENKVEWLESEKKIYSKQYDYAGTLDAEAKVNNELAIIDFKTSNGIYDEYFLQVAAYIQARKEETGNDYKKAYIVRIGKDGELEVKELDNFDKHLRVFLGALEIYKWQQDLRTEKINK